MRIYQLHPIADADIKDTHVLAIDESVSTKKMTLAQLRKYFNIGTAAIDIPVGTDIHQYFLTAPSGRYDSDASVTNTAHPGQMWYEFNWQISSPNYGVLEEHTNGALSALHILSAGVWKVAKIITDAGGDINGSLTINKNDAALILRPTTQDAPIYIRGNDADGTQRFFIGKPAQGIHDVTMYNYHLGSEIRLAQDGQISIKSINGGGTYATEHFEAGHPTGAGSWVSQYATKAPYYHSYRGESISEFHPIFKERAENQGFAWSGGILTDTREFAIHMENYDGTEDIRFFFSPNGQINPGNYSNFDTRYVNGIRLAIYASGSQVFDSAHRVVTGVSHANGYDQAPTVESRVLQYAINNTWYDAPYI